MTVGFFDSGIGGITVLKEALKILPEEKYIYYADNFNAPYGTKNKKEVKKYIFRATEFIRRKGIDVLVVACNTATSVAINDLRIKYNFPIVGMEPAVKPAVKACSNKRVLVLATPLTLKEEKFQNLVSRVDSENIVDSLALPELVEYAENFVFDEKIIIPYLKEKMSGVNLKQYETIVFGCTHFPYYRKLFKEVIPENIDLIDGNRGTVKHLQNIMKEKGLIENCGLSITFYSSGKENNKLLAKYLQKID